MTQQRDGGPAFPVTLLTSQDTVDKDGKKIGKINMPVQYPGMNLRDWFAGQALPGIINGFVNERGHLPETKDQWENIARKAGICAAHMVYDREQE